MAPEFSDGGSASRPLSTVEPVVVSPDMASKNAPVKDSPGMLSSRGSAAAAGSNSHPSVTSRKPSRGLSSRRKRCVAPASRMPQPAVIAPLSRKRSHSPSCSHSEHSSGAA